MVIPKVAAEASAKISMSHRPIIETTVSNDIEGSSTKYQNVECGTNIIENDRADNANDTNRHNANPDRANCGPAGRPIGLKH